MNPEILRWLTHQGSITNKLKLLTHDVRIEVLENTWETADNWDQKNLSLTSSSEVLHRNIVMWAEDTPCWYARTILPETAYQSEQALFDRLKHQALGELIHNHPDIKRTKIHPYTITPDMPEFEFLKAALQQNTPETNLWGRISTFTIRNQFDFYLLEIFLPGVLKYCL